MAYVQNLPTFVIAGLMLNLTPGADMLLVASRSARGGFPSGVAASLGIATGCLVHILLASLGVATLVAAVPGLSAGLRILGGVYLGYLGIGLCRPKPADAPAMGRNGRDSFVQGLMTNFLNPKVGLFFLAFLPPFVAPDAPSRAWALIGLGLVFNLGGTLVNLTVAGLAARGRTWSPGAGVSRVFSTAVGLLMMALGITLMVG